LLARAVRLSARAPEKETSTVVDFTLTDEQKALREMAHDFAEKEMRPVAWEYDKEGTWPEDVMRTVTIRGEPHTVLQAVNRQIEHYAQHIGQIVFLAKHLRSGEWKTLSIPRGKSEDYKAVRSKDR